MSESSTPAASSSPGDRPNSVVIRIWPNIPIMYPMAVAAILCGIFSLMFGIDSELKRLTARPPGVTVQHPSESIEVDHVVKYADMQKKVRTEQIIAMCFLAVFLYTLVVVTTDIVITWALLGVAIATIIGLLLFILNLYYGILAGLSDILNAFMPVANAHFYFGVAATWAVLMIAGIIYSRLHYVRIEPNEVIAIGGLLDKRRRYSTMRMQYTKEIHDVFEYYLPFVRSGRLILRFPNQEEPIIIDHVMQIDDVVKKLDQVATYLQVSERAHDD